MVETLAQAAAMYLLIVTTYKGTETNLFSTVMTLELCQAKIAQLKERNPKLQLRERNPKLQLRCEQVQ